MKLSPLTLSVLASVTLLSCTRNKVSSKQDDKPIGQGEGSVATVTTTSVETQVTTEVSQIPVHVTVSSPSGEPSKAELSPIKYVVKETSSPQAVANAVTDYINANAAALGVSSEAKCRLDVKRILAHSRGKSIWFKEVCNEIVLDARSILGQFNEKGELKFLSLAKFGSKLFDSKSAIKLEDAIRAVLSERKLPSLEMFVREYINGELVGLVSSDGSVQLAWRVSVADFPETAKELGVPFVAWIGANGPATGKVLRTESGLMDLARVKVFNSQMIPIIPSARLKGLHVLTNNEEGPDLKAVPADQRSKLVPASAHVMSKNMQSVRDFYATRLGRDGFDNLSGDINACVEAGYIELLPLGTKFNAFWNPLAKMFVFGAGGKQFDGFAEAIDVAGHEFTHAVISHTSDLAYRGQTGALNEHFADVFGELIQHAVQPQSVAFKIGETLTGSDLKGKPLRDMEDPANSYSKQPGHMNEYPEKYGPSCTPSGSNDNCGVHNLSGIPNRMASIVIKKLGWEKSEKLFYAVMTARLRSEANFAEYKSEMANECKETLSSEDCVVVNDAFAQVGL